MPGDRDAIYQATPTIAVDFRRGARALQAPVVQGRVEVVDRAKCRIGWISRNEQSFQADL